MNYETLICETDTRGVATVTMNRPDAGNSFDEKLIEELTQIYTAFNDDEDVRIIVLTGAGKVFSAGADLNMMKRIAGYSEEQNVDEAKRMSAMLERIFYSPKPTIARINGAAIGGGVGLASVCNIAIAADKAVFALSEVRIGLIPAVISPFVIRAIGLRQADKYFLTAERFNAEQAKSINLVHDVCTIEALDDEVQKITGNLLNGAPGAQAETKLLIDSVSQSAMSDELFIDTAKRIARIRSAPEGREGISAFLEKRTPNWANKENV